jgi:hypothetical protein
MAAAQMRLPAAFSPKDFSIEVFSLAGLSPRNFSLANAPLRLKSEHEIDRLLPVSWAKTVA